MFSGLLDILGKMGTILSAVLDVWFLIFPPILYFLFKTLWMHYAWGKYASTLKWVLLEIVPPRELEKSPLLMESVFAGFAGVVKSPTAAEEVIKGEFPSSFSLELVSTEGKVRFFVRTQTGFRNLVEAHFYAQYPDIEIIEVPDYVLDVPKTVPNREWDLWGTDFSLVKDDLYPIKTYKYFEESVTGKMVDPLAGLVETMGKIGPGQHMWLQFITTPIKEDWAPKSGKPVRDAFIGKVKEKPVGLLMLLLQEIWDIIGNIGKGIMGREIEFAAGAAAEKKDEQPLEFRLSPGEKKILEALENNMGKQPFRIRMRYVYLGRRDVFSKPLGVSAFIGGIKQFADMNLNSFKPNDDAKTYANYVMTESRLRYRQRRIFRRYITRDSDPQSSRFILTSEELATVFHMPDMAVLAPSISRVSAKRGGAPSNLPVQEFE